MTPGKHIVPNEVELKCFLFSGLIQFVKFISLNLKGKKAFFVTRVFKYVSENILFHNTRVKYLCDFVNS